MTARLVQVTNVSTSVTKEQLKALFTHLGRIEDVQLYPESETLTATVAAKTGYVRFDRSELALAALNLTNTVFLDRPIICSIVKYATSSSVLSSKAIAQLCRIPDETVAIKLCPSINSKVTLIPGGITWPHNIINRIVTIPGVAGSLPVSFIETLDPNLTERSLPAYPHLPGSMDQQKAEEIRRTVYVSNLDSRVQFAHLYELFTQVGEIRYVRLTDTTPSSIQLENRGLSTMCLMNDDENVEWSEVSVSAYIEFSEQPMVLKALCLNGLSFAGRTIKVNHATDAIVIPATNKQQISVEDIRKEISKLRHSTSSSSSHRTDRARSDRDRDDKDSHNDKNRPRDRDRNRDRDRERGEDRHSKTETRGGSTKEREERSERTRRTSRHRDSRHKESSSGAGSAVKTSGSGRKKDGSVDEKTDEESDEEEQGVVAAAAGVVNGSEGESAAESEQSEVGASSPKKARHSRSRSDSKSAAKKRSSKDRSPRTDRHRTGSHKRSSRSREREKRDRDLAREKELRERLKASTAASAAKRSSRDREVSRRDREVSSSKEHKRSNGGSKSESTTTTHKRDRERKRSSSRTGGKSKKRSKSKEKSSKEHHKKSSRRRSKSPRDSTTTKTSSRSSHKHSKSSKSDKKDSRHDKRDKHDSEDDPSVAAMPKKTRDYDEEERNNAATMDVTTDVAQSSYGPEPAANGQATTNSNGNGKAESSSDDSGGSSSGGESEADEPMDVAQQNGE